MNYPATFELEAPLQIARWRPLVNWLMAIPHMIIAQALNYATQFVAVIAWFAILFTGKLPVGLGNFMAMSVRYGERAYTFAGYLYEDYPPFGFDMQGADPGGSPVISNFDIAFENRNRLTVAFRIILAIPALLFVAVVGIVAAILWVISFFAILFTGAWPQGMRDFVLKSMRLSHRVNAYMFLLTDEYPPFSLD
ncbi:MAG: DUF4389 domain-containing protein [Acidimicrobiales bacterium]